MAEIQLEADKNRLIVKAEGFEEGQLLLSLPSRRWMPSRGVFVVPMTRMNCKMLYDAVLAGQCAINLEPPGFQIIHEVAYPNAPDRKWPEAFNFVAKPFPDQLRACQKIYTHDAGALFMRPGSGKSYVAINLFSRAFTDDLIDCAVVLCPLTVSTVWAGDDGQVKKFSPIRAEADTSIWLGQDPQRRTMYWLIKGIESLSQGGAFDMLQNFLRGKRYALLVDESSRIKNHKAIRTERAIELGKKAIIRLIATGTPATKSLLDLYSQFEFLDPNIIGVGDFYAFRNRYCKMGGYKNKEIVGYNHVDELMGLIEPYTYRCDKPAGLPKKLYTERVVELTRNQREVYNKVKAAGFEGISVANILNRIEKLQQVVGGYLKEDPQRVRDPVTGRERKQEGKILWVMATDENPKIKALLEFIEEIGDEQCVIWCKHLWEIEEARRTLHQETGAVCGVIVGATPVEERADIISNFQQGNITHFIGNQPTGGIGITLTAAHYCFYYSNTFSWEDRMQSEDRLHRIGQENNVLYCDCWAGKSVEILVKNALKEKMDLDAYVAKMLDQVGSKGILEII